MAKILLVDNPRRKRRSSKKRRKASPAQLRARRNFIKMVRAKRRKATRRNPAHTTARRRQSGVKHRPVFFGTKDRIGVRSIHKRLNPRKGLTSMARRRHRRKYRRNPSFAGLRSHATGLGGQVKNAAIGALGIVANNQIKPMVQGLLGNTLGSFTPVANALVPLVIGNMVRSPLVKLAAQTAAAVELAALVGNVGGLLGPATAGPVNFLQPANPPGGVQGDDNAIPPPLGR